MSLSDYVEIKKIGQGSFGEVWLHEHQGDKKQYVIKKMVLTDDGMKKSAEMEIRLLSDINHPNVVSYKASFSQGDNIYLIMEYCDSGDLAQRIKDCVRMMKGFSEKQITDWTLDLCFALEHIHARNILHRDLKPQNIFLTQKNIIKIGDFGIGRMLEPGKLASTIVGTPLYVSPEVVEGKPYDSKVDVWSLGCVIYEMMTLEPAVNAELIMLLPKRRVARKMPTYYGKQLTKLIESMLSTDPNKRPTINKIMASEFIREAVNSRVTVASPSAREPAAHVTQQTPTQRDVGSNSVFYFELPEQLESPPQSPTSLPLTPSPSSPASPAGVPHATVIHRVSSPRPPVERPVAVHQHVPSPVTPNITTSPSRQPPVSSKANLATPTNSHSSPLAPAVTPASQSTTSNNVPTNIILLGSVVLLKTVVIIVGLTAVWRLLHIMACFWLYLLALVGVSLLAAHLLFDADLSAVVSRINIRAACCCSQRLAAVCLAQSSNYWDQLMDLLPRVLEVRRTDPVFGRRTLIRVGGLCLVTILLFCLQRLLLLSSLRSLTLICVAAVTAVLFCVLCSNTDQRTVSS